MSIALSTQGLMRSFGAVKGADNISVAFEAGTVVALIGTNGAGKTTFLNLVTGYPKPDAGTVLLGERDITGMEPREITRLGVARSFQIPQLFDQLTVDENLEVAETIARHTSTVSQSKQLAKTLPGGARKLLDIAMAIVSHPSVLVLDEPTSGVSAEEKESVVETVIELARGLNAMTLFVEHDMEVVAQYADRVLAFFEGRIIADGTAAEVLDAPEVRRLIVGTALGAEGHA